MRIRYFKNNYDYFKFYKKYKLKINHIRVEYKNNKIKCIYD